MKTIDYLEVSIIYRSQFHVTWIGCGVGLGVVGTKHKKYDKHKKCSNCLQQDLYLTPIKTEFLIHYFFFPLYFTKIHPTPLWNHHQFVQNSTDRLDLQSLVTAAHLGQYHKILILQGFLLRSLLTSCFKIVFIAFFKWSVMVIFFFFLN